MAWDIAGASFGEALAFELKDKVFAPFFSEFPGLTLDKHWQAIHDNRAALGQLIEALLQSRHGANIPGRKLAIWLPLNRPQLIHEVTRNEKALSRITKLRNDAQHQELSVEGVRELFDSICQVMRAIHVASMAQRLK